MTRSGQRTPGQLALLAFIVRYMRQHGHPPTIPEMAQGTGAVNATAYMRLAALERAGYVVRTGRHPRAIVVLRRVEDERERGK